MSFGYQFELVEKVSALQAFETSGVRVPKHPSTFPSHNRDATISAQWGVADLTLQSKETLTAEDIDAVTASNAASPFLSLVQDMKDRIYEFVAGGSLIHIHYSNDNKLRHHTCQAVITENDAQHIFDTTEDPWFASAVTDRHARCYEYSLFESLDMRKPFNRPGRGVSQCKPSAKHNSLDLRFLRTCKQIYHESASTPFTSNTFSFTRPRIIHAFLARNPKATLIRKVHLEMTITQGLDETIWTRATRTVASQLNSLQRLYIDIDFQPTAEFMPQRAYVANPAHNPFMKSLVQICIPQLRTVTITLSDVAMGNHRWTMGQKRKWTEYIKGVVKKNRVTGVALTGVMPFEGRM